MVAVLDIAVIALDQRKRVRVMTVYRLSTLPSRKIEGEISDQLLMADISTFEEGLTAVEAGVDLSERPYLGTQIIARK